MSSAPSQARRPLPPRLLALSPGDLQPARFAAWLQVVQRCVEVGLRGILLREPHLPDGLRLYLALQLARIMQPGGGFVCLHDSAHLAHGAGVDAVHLGFRSLGLQDVRRWLPEGVSIGVSTHYGDPLDWDTPPEYSFYGPVFETPSKVGWKDPVGLENLRNRCLESAVPIWGLGGISVPQAAEVLDSGAAGLAVRGALWNSKRPWHVVSEFEVAMGGSLG